MRKELAVSGKSTLEQVEAWLSMAKQLGYQIRYDHFGASGGGVCEYAGQKWIFMDVGLSAWEQLEQLANQLPLEPEFAKFTDNQHVRATLDKRAA